MVSNWSLGTLNRQYYFLAAIASLVLAVFSPVLWNDFVNYDDPLLVFTNPYIQQGLTFKGIYWAFTSIYDANWIPLTWLSHMLDVQLFGMNPAGHHVVNVLIHVISTCLLFSFLNKTTNAPFRSVAVALLFGLHPLRVESVAWVAERKDVLSTFFATLTLYLYAYYVESPKITRYFFVYTAFLMGMLSKSMLVTLPLVMFLMDYWPLKRFDSVDSSGRLNMRRNVTRLFIEKIPFLFLAAIIGTVTYVAHSSQGSVSKHYTFFYRLGKASIAYFTYLYKMIWPVKLAVIYPYPLYPPPLATMVASAIGLIFISGVVIYLRNDCHYLIVGWLWYLFTLLPVIGLIQIGLHSIADRYTYMPLTGIFIVMVWGVADIPISTQRYRYVTLAFLSLIILLVMIALTQRQLKYWKNSIILFTHAIEVTQNNWVAHNNLGQALFESGRIDEAIFQFRSSIIAKPSYDVACINLALAYRERGDYNESIKVLNDVLLLNPFHEIAHYELGIIYLETGRKDLALLEHKKLDTFKSEYARELLNRYNLSLKN